MRCLIKLRTQFITGTICYNRQNSIPNHNLSWSTKFRRFCLQSNNNNNTFRILGIETSCDDTGCAIVDSDRNVLGESLQSQLEIHLANGGIIPPLAYKLHLNHIHSVVDEALTSAGMTMRDIDAVAATVKPGMSLSLKVGSKYGCHLSRQWKKPFIPIHHMEAHALTGRLVDEVVQFPYLSLLISGGHTLLVFVESVDSFLLLGESLDDSIGSVLDKIARRMKLHNLPEFRTCSGGQAVEVMASRATNPERFTLSVPLTMKQDCTFSFSGLRNKAFLLIEKEENTHGTEVDGIIETASDLCAAIQLTLARHLCHRVVRGMVFLEQTGMIAAHAHPALVVSGGVACNKFFAKALKHVCDERCYHFCVPPPKLCNDNGAMIAWNGVERYRENLGVLPWDQLQSVQVEVKAPVGKDITEQVKAASISCEWVKIGNLLKKVDSAT